MFWSGIAPCSKIIYIANKINLKQSGRGEVSQSLGILEEVNIRFKDIVIYIKNLSKIKTMKVMKTAFLFL